MNQLLKQILIVNAVLLVLGILFISFTYYQQNYIKNYPIEIKYDSAGKPLPAMIPEVPFYSLFEGLVQIFFWLFPILVILMSAIYLFKNPSLKDYFKSLLIPLSYGFLAMILTLILIKVGSYTGEGGALGFVFMSMQTGATFALVLIINLVILGIKLKIKR
jgi:hypothetical protein